MKLIWCSVRGTSHWGRPPCMAHRRFTGSHFESGLNLA